MPLLIQQYFNTKYIQYLRILDHYSEQKSPHQSQQ
jgi:hypothetical protein